MASGDRRSVRRRSDRQAEADAKLNSTATAAALDADVDGMSADGEDVLSAVASNGGDGGGHTNQPMSLKHRTTVPDGAIDRQAVKNLSKLIARKNDSRGAFCS